MTKYLIVDAHEDLAYNIQNFGRDYTRSARDTRLQEAGKGAAVHNGDTLLGWPEYLRGHVALVFATIFAGPERYRQGEWDSLTYSNSDEAHQIYLGQLDAYEELCDRHPGKFRFVRSTQELASTLEPWVKHIEEKNDQPPELPVGLVVLIEGGEGIRRPEELEDWWQAGVRIIGPAWTGTRFCGGTGEPGGLTAEGRELLDQMAELGFILDLSHMAEQAVMQALDSFPGQIIASHSNASALVRQPEGGRHLTDQMIQGIIERNGVIGVVPYNKFLKKGWKKGDPRELVPLQYVADQVDYICQKSGGTKHAGLGTDFDGGFGLQSVPPEVESIADLQKLSTLFEEKGYGREDIAAIFGKNWINKLENSLPDGL